MIDNLRFEGRVAVVTGAGGGLGPAAQVAAEIVAAHWDWISAEDGYSVPTSATEEVALLRAHFRSEEVPAR